MCFKFDNFFCNKQKRGCVPNNGGSNSKKEQDIRSSEEAQKEQSDVMKDQSATEKQPTKSAPTSEGVVATSINGIKSLIDNLTKKKRTIIVGYVFLMLLFVLVVALMARALIKLHELLILSEIPYVLLLFAVLFVCFAIMVYLALKVLVICQRYQSAINRLDILLSRLNLGMNEQSKEFLIDNELKMIARILEEKSGSWLK